MKDDMAIVKQYDDYFCKIRHRVKIKCSASTGKFSIELPVEAHEAISERVTANTFNEVVQKYKAAKIQFTQAASRITKVILVKFDNKISFADGINFEFACGVFEKTEWPNISEAVKYYAEDSGLPDEVDFCSNVSTWDVENECVELIWTAEQEQFFVKFSEALLVLVEKMKDFTKSKKSLLSFMTYQKSLPGWKSK